MGILLFALLVAVFLYILYLVGKGVSKILFIIPLGLVIVCVVSMLPDLLAVGIVLLGVILGYNLIKKILGFKSNICCILVLIILMILFIHVTPLGVILLIGLLIRAPFMWVKNSKDISSNNEDNSNLTLINKNENNIKIN